MPEIAFDPGAFAGSSLVQRALDLLDGGADPVQAAVLAMIDEGRAQRDALGADAVVGLDFDYG